MDFTGRALKGMVYVGMEGVENDANLSEGIDTAGNFAGDLPRK